MTSLILICHAPLGHALHAVACHAFGRYIAEVVVADIAANSSLDDAVAAIEAAWKQEGQPQQVGCSATSWAPHPVMRPAPGSVCTPKSTPAASPVLAYQ